MQFIKHIFCLLCFLWLSVLFSVQFSSVSQSCPTLCNPMNCSTPGLPVPHQLPKFTQTHFHWVGDIIQPFYPPAFDLSQHQGRRCTKYWQLADIYIPYLLRWVKVAQSYPILRPHGLYSPWNSLGQNAGVGSLSLLQWMLVTQESNWGPCIAGGFFTNWSLFVGFYSFYFFCILGVI